MPLVYIGACASVLFARIDPCFTFDEAAEELRQRMVKIYRTFGKTVQRFMPNQSAIYGKTPGKVFYYCHITCANMLSMRCPRCARPSSHMLLHIPRCTASHV